MRSEFPRIDSSSAPSTVNPLSARRIAGAITFSSGIEPYRASAVVSPATDPGTPDARCPIWLFVGDVPGRVEVHVARRRERRDLAIVERERSAVAQPNEHVAAAAEIAGLGVRHRERESRGDGRVDRVAALAQDRESGVAREGAVARRPSHAAPPPCSWSPRAASFGGVECAPYRRSTGRPSAASIEAGVLGSVAGTGALTVRFAGWQEIRRAPAVIAITPIARCAISDARCTNSPGKSLATGARRGIS